MIDTFQTTRPLYSLNDAELLSLVKFLSVNMMELNSRKITLTEILYNEGGWYPSFYFRLTSEIEEPINKAIQKQVCGFVFAIDLDFDEDIILQPLTEQGYLGQWLKEMGITHVFISHNVGIIKLHNFLKKTLKLWDLLDNVQYRNHQKPNEWRIIQNAIVNFA